MESQPQNPEVRINPENFRPCINSKINLRMNMCDFVCGTMSHAKSSLHWSVYTIR